MREVTNDELKKVVYGINSAFRNVTSFNMPYPGPTVVSASASTKQWKVQGKWITRKPVTLYLKHIVMIIQCKLINLMLAHIYQHFKTRTSSLKGIPD